MRHGSQQWWTQSSFELFEVRTLLTEVLDIAGWPKRRFYESRRRWTAKIRFVCCWISPKWMSLVQVIQSDLFNPRVGGHQQPLSSGHLTSPKRSPAESPGLCHMLVLNCLLLKYPGNESKWMLKVDFPHPSNTVVGFVGDSRPEKETHPKTWIHTTELLAL